MGLVTLKEDMWLWVYCVIYKRNYTGVSQLEHVCICIIIIISCRRRNDYGAPTQILVHIACGGYHVAMLCPMKHPGAFVSIFPLDFMP